MPPHPTNGGPSGLPPFTVYGLPDGNGVQTALKSISMENLLSTLARDEKIPSKPFKADEPLEELEGLVRTLEAKREW
jgi:hypothetical protein